MWTEKQNQLRATIIRHDNAHQTTNTLADQVSCLRSLARTNERNKVIISFNWVNEWIWNRFLLLFFPVFVFSLRGFSLYISSSICSFHFLSIDAFCAVRRAYAINNNHKLNGNGVSVGQSGDGIGREWSSEWTRVRIDEWHKRMMLWNIYNFAKIQGNVMCVQIVL